MAGIIPKQLRCEYRQNPLGIDVLHPRLSWVLEAEVGCPRGQRQQAYQVLVASSPCLLEAEKGDLWDSGKVDSDESIHVVYEGVPLRSRQRCFWKVRVWGANGEVSSWSEVASWTMGLLKANEWKAKWIGGPLTIPWAETESPPSPMLRKSFSVGGMVKNAVVYASALGLYDLRINGKRVGDHVLAPEWTNYYEKVQY